MKPSFLPTIFAGALCMFISCDQKATSSISPIKASGSDAADAVTNLQVEQESTTSIKAGYYESDHPDHAQIDDFLGKSTVTIWLSSHNGISMERNDRKGWDNNLTLDQLKTRIETTEDKSHASIMLEKNFTQDNKEDESVAELLTKLGFQTIVVQSSHSSATVIEKIIRNTK